ncbi:unnamed protein product [Arctogadus glacialis]
MSDGDSDQAVEADEEAELDSDEAALLYFSRQGDSRRALPWDQWSFREKANFLMDRIFLGFLAVFLLLLFAEVCYKVWYLTDVRKIAAFLTDASGGLVDWLFAKVEDEERVEL